MRRAVLEYYRIINQDQVLSWVGGPHFPAATGELLS